MKTNILILLAHPNYKDSRANRAMIDAVSDMENVKIRNLQDVEPTPDNYRDDVAKADIIIFQFPTWWLHSPWPLEQWMDACMLPFMDNPGFKGKRLMVATTTGSGYSSYRAGGACQFTIDELMRPYQVSALYSGLGYITPFAIYGTMTPDAEKNIAEGAKAYRSLLESF